MKIKLLLAALWLGGANLIAAPVGTSFTYQGRITVGSAAANGVFDLQFALYDADTNGGQVGVTLNQSATGVSNGLFTVNLDFGSDAFNGTARWLEIGVRTNGGSAFTLLSPRQTLAAAPYAIYAPSAGAAASVTSGAITSAMLANEAVTSAKLGVAAVKPANIDDGGSVAYGALVAALDFLSPSNALPFTALSLVTSNSGTPPTFAFALGGEEFGTVAGFVGHEGLSEPYEFVVEVIAPSASLIPETQLGQTGRLTFGRNGRATSFAGIISGCSVAAYDASNELYTFRLASPLAYLALTSDSRVRQDISVPDLVSGLYHEDTANTLVMALTGDYSLRTSVIQFGETDLNFFSRLLEDEGIFYFFRPGEIPRALVLGDAPGAYLTAAGSPLRYYGNQATNIPTGAEFIRTFGKTTRESARTATVNSYNFTTPNLPLVADRSGTAERGELYEYGGFKTTADGTRRARLRLEQLEGQRHLMFGSGNAADLRPGYKFELDDRSGANLQNEYLVTAVRHSGFRRTTNGVASLYYGNQFEVIPAALPYRPARKTPRPVASTSTAIVTGPAGEEIWTDKYGRVKVQFHWDRSGARDETASAWVRVASPWAGPGWGMIFTPRVGQEVKVEFVNGDPDEPIVTGSFYNGLNLPPYALPTDKTKSGIKTHSSPNGTAANFNEIRFEDKKGAEELYLHAEKDLNLEVKNDVTFAVNHDLALGVDHDLSLEVGNNLTISTPNNLTIMASAGLGLNAPNNPAVALNVGGTVAAPAVNVSGTVTATSFSGSGAALSGVNAVNTDTLDGQHGAFYQNLANLTGTLPDARLSANVALLNNSQTFTGAKTFSGLLTLNNTVQMQASVFLNDRDIQLRGDAWHGLGWYGNPKFFAGVNVNGPVLYGNGGGGLGTISGTTTNLALLWNTSGNVGIGTPTPTHVLHVNSASTTNTMRLTGPGVNGAGAKLNFGDGEYVYLHEVSDDFLRVQATRMGIGRAPTANKFELEGDASKATAGSWLANSDARIKQDIQPITNALEKISQVRLVSFRYKDDYRQQHPSIEPRAYVNVVAQEFQQVFPEAVQSSGEKLATGENILQVDTYPLTIYSAAAVQELQQRLTVELQRRDAENAALQARLEKLEQLLKVSRGDSQ